MKNILFFCLGAITATLICFAGFHHIKQQILKNIPNSIIKENIPNDLNFKIPDFGVENKQK